MIEIIETYKATISFTSPTAYRAMMAAMDEGADLSSLRMAVSAGETLPAPVFEDWTQQDRQADPRRHRLHRDAAHLHHQPPRRCRARRHRQAGRRLRGQDRRRRHERGAATARSAISPCAGRPAAAISPTTRQTKYVRDGWNLTGDDFMQRRGRRLPLRRPRRRHDHLVGLQHRRPGGGGGAARASRGRRMRRDRRARRGARPDRRGARGAERRHRRRRGLHQAPAGPRQGDDRALQVSALGQVRRRAAQDPDRQDPALQAEAQA